MNRARLAVVLVMLAVGAAIAADEAGTFRGLRFGADLTKQVPECPRTGTYYAFNVSRSCWQQSDECLEARANAAGCGVPRMVRLLDEQNGDFDANAGRDTDSEVFVEVGGDRALTRMYFYVPPERFASAVRALLARYGAPSADEIEPGPAKKNGGDTLRRRTWQGRGLRIELITPSDAAAQGMIDVSGRP